MNYADQLKSLDPSGSCIGTAGGYYKQGFRECRRSAMQICQRADASIKLLEDENLRLCDLIAAYVRASNNDDTAGDAFGKLCDEMKVAAARAAAKP